MKSDIRVNIDANPYSPPMSGLERVPSSEPRAVAIGMLLLAGAALGSVSFLTAMTFIPTSADSTTTHDLRLANNLGFIYPPLLGLWVGWVRRSIPWAVYGLVSGLSIGFAYYAFCGTNFLAVMVGFPCMFGGPTSVLLGTHRESWISGIPLRLIRGLVSGFVLGFTYMLALNITFPFTSPGFPFSNSVSDHSHGMWVAGTFALTLASALYLPVFHWSAGLNDHRRRQNDAPSHTPEP